jgi:hypothetical protein
MRFLIAGDRKVLRRGPFVKADASAHEFIYDTDTVEEMKEVTVAVLKSIAENNGIHVTKNATRADLIQNLNTNLPSLKIPEQNTMSQSDIITSVVAAAAANRDPSIDPEMLEINIFTACIQKLNEQKVAFKIKALGGLVKKEIAEQGLLISSSQRKEELTAILEEEKFAPTTWEQVEAMVEHLTKKVSDTDSSQALSGIKRFLKANERELPKREKVSKAPFRVRMAQFLAKCSPASDAAIMEFIKASKRPDPEKDFERVNSKNGLREIVDMAFAAGLSAGQSAAEESKAA